jgi:O-acetyl-ADP-ribose deacetylase (regulator of RNase III)
MEETNQYDETIDNDLFSTMGRETNEPSISVDIDVVKDDITKREVDIIVNAAHEHLTGGGGVDGAIHKAAGQKLLGECLLLYGCPEGEVRITNGYDLLAKYIIHTVGPVWTPNKENQEEAKVNLAKCYKNSLDLAEIQGLKSIAFPCISTGAYCFPKELAAEIAIHTIYEWFHHLFLSQRPDAKVGCYLDKVEIVCFSDEDVEIYSKAIANEEAGRILPKCTNLEKAGVCSYISPSDNGCRFGKKCWADRDKE